MWYSSIVMKVNYFYVPFPFTEGITTQTQTNNLTTPSTPQSVNVTTSTAPQTQCPNIIQNITKSVLYQLKVKWIKGSSCEGQLYLDTGEHKRPLCFNTYKSSWWNEVCKDTRCGDFKSYKPTSSQTPSFMLTSNMTIIDTTECKGLHIMCQGVCVYVFIYREQIYCIDYIYDSVCWNVSLDVFVSYPVS